MAGSCRRLAPSPNFVERFNTKIPLYSNVSILNLSVCYLPAMSPPAPPPPVFLVRGGAWLAKWWSERADEAPVLSISSPAAGGRHFVGM